MPNFVRLKNEIVKIISNSPLKEDPKHSKNTLKWILKLKPDSDDALKIAALAHDIDRGITGISDTDFNKKRVTKKFRADHANRCAEVITRLMEENNFDRKQL